MPCNESMVPHSVMVSRINAAVLAEREACAKIADEATKEAETILDAFLTSDLSWQYALNEMSEAVNKRFNMALRKWHDIAVEIRARGK